jgi:hypothetical protein
MCEGAAFYFANTRGVLDTAECVGRTGKGLWLPPTPLYFSFTKPSEVYPVYAYS